MKRFPLPDRWQDERLVALGRKIHVLALEQEANAPARAIAGDAWTTADELRARLSTSEARFGRAADQMVVLQEELDWLVYSLHGIVDEGVGEPTLNLECEATPPAELIRPFLWDDDHASATGDMSQSQQAIYRRRRSAIESNTKLAVLESPVYKRLWRGRQGVFGRYDREYREHVKTALSVWLLQRIEREVAAVSKMVTPDRVTAKLQTDPKVLAACEIFRGRKDFSLSKATRELLEAYAVPSSPHHRYTQKGHLKADAWGRSREEPTAIPPRDLPKFVASDFVAPSVWRLRGKLDVPQERFIAFTELPAGGDSAMAFGWSGWSAIQRLKVMLAADEELEDGGVLLADRVGLLDSAWRLLPDVAREDPAAASRLKAELQALVGTDGPSPEMLDDWRERFPAPGARKTSKRKRKK